MGTRFLMAVLPVWLLVPAADGQEPPLSPLPSGTFRCETTVAVPDGPPPAIDYQVVEAPSGTTTEIGVLFLYVDEFQSTFVETSVEEWVRTANRLFQNGTSGVRLTVAGVRSAPSSVNRASRGEASLSSLLEAAISADSTIRQLRAEVGGDIVTVVAPEADGDSFGGIARAWLNHMAGNEMKRQAYNVVRLRTFGGLQYRQAEGLVLAHEVGHNLGLVHDWKRLMNDHGRDPARNPHPDVLKARLWDSAGFGYLNPDEQVGQCLTPSCYLGTIMSVADWHLLGFSRPSGSLPAFLAEHVRLDAGDSSTNADRALRRTAGAVADFYTTPSDDPPPDDDPEPEPEPEPDEPPCRAAGEGLNLDGHQLFMCIVVNGEVQQLAAHRLSSRSMLFGRVADPKAVVKLVRSCQWGAVAAVVTARKFQIRVYNTANGKEWVYNHTASGLAPSGYSGDALCD